jgi:hypothetical protein
MSAIKNSSNHKLPSPARRRVLSLIPIILLFVPLYIATRFFEISAFVFSILFAVIGFIAIYLIDVYLVPEFDTATELRKGNVAVAIYYLALALLLSAAIVAGSGSLGFVATP